MEEKGYRGANEPYVGEKRAEEVSDIVKLSNKLITLRETLKTFESRITKLHSDVFNEEPKVVEEGLDGGSPKNKVDEIIRMVDGCFIVQRRIVRFFNDFDNMLCWDSNKELRG